MRPLLAAMLLAASLAAFGQASEVERPDARTEQRLKQLAEELRCLVCQNQTIADSNAPLAVDLRQQIRGQIAQGRSDDDIRGYMVDRYGDFVLYRPPLRATTVLLWAGPFILVAIGLFVFYGVVRRRPAAPAAPLSEAESASLRSLLDEGESRAPGGGRKS